MIFKSDSVFSTLSIQNSVILNATEAVLFVSTSYLYFKWQKHKLDLERKNILEGMPKVELHVHFDGSFDFFELLTNLQQENNHDEIFPECVTLPWSEPFPLRKIVRESSNNVNDFYNLCTW